jgi:hypothetical protein
MTCRISLGKYHYQLQLTSGNVLLRIKTYVFVPWARLYHSNRKQSFTFELEGSVNEINHKLCVTKLFNYENRQMAHTSASDFKVFTGINHVRFAHRWVDKKLKYNLPATLYH